MNLPAVAARLPLFYTLAVIAELVWLTHRWVTDPPASSSMLSIGLGWAGLGSMVIMLIYSVARRSRRFRQMARLSAWLHFHIFMGVQGMVFVIFHSMHLFTREAAVNFLNPAVVNFGAVIVVFFSGLFGRYLYSLLPRAATGEQLAARDVEAELAKLEKPLPAHVEALWKDAPRASTFVELVKTDLETRRAIAGIDREGLDPATAELAKRRVRLARRLSAVVAADRIFRRWIVLHRPIAAIMYVLSAVHVALSYMFTPSLGR